MIFQDYLVCGVGIEALVAVKAPTTLCALCDKSRVSVWDCLGNKRLHTVLLDMGKNLTDLI